MIGTTVCRTHGGGAPQVRRAAERRTQTSTILAFLARHQAEREAELAAMAPWSAELRQLMIMRHIAPAESATKLRAIARQMTRIARGLREEAAALDARNKPSA
jgi:hypothetical protein